MIKHVKMTVTIPVKGETEEDIKKTMQEFVDNANLKYVIAKFEDFTVSEITKISDIHKEQYDKEQEEGNKIKWEE